MGIKPQAPVSFLERAIRPDLRPRPGTFPCATCHPAKQIGRRSTAMGHADVEFRMPIQNSAVDQRRNRDRFLRGKADDDIKIEPLQAHDLPAGPSMPAGPG